MVPSRKPRHPDPASMNDHPQFGSAADVGGVMGAKNPRIVELRRLLGRRSSRSPEVLLEGPRTVGEAIDAGFVPDTVIVPDDRADQVAVTDVLDRLTPDVEVVVVRGNAFDRLAPSVTPQPMLAIVPRPMTVIPDSLGSGDVVLVLVEVSDPGNMGTLIRVADAVGAVCVVSIDGADPWGQKAVRSSTGSVMRVPVVTGLSTSEALTALRSAGARVVGTDVTRGAAHDSGVLKAPVAIVLGSEAHGLSHDLDPLVDDWVKIEMSGRAESLNVAMAGTLLAFEARRSD